VNERNLISAMGLSLPLPMVMVSVLLLTWIVLAAIIIGCVLGFALSLLITRRRSMGLRANSFGPRSIVLGLALSLIPILINEVALGFTRFSLLPCLMRRIYAFPVFLVASIVFFWVYLRASILTTNRHTGIMYEALDMAVLLLPPIILIVLLTLIVSPGSLIIVMPIAGIHIAAIMILSLLGRHLEMDTDAKTVLCATIYASLAALSPITKIVIL